MQQIQSALAALRAYANRNDDIILQQLLSNLAESLNQWLSTSGESYITGNITDSVGVAIGHSAQAHVDQSHTTMNIDQVFETIQERLDALPAKVEAVTPKTIKEAQGEVDDLKQEVLKGQGADEGFLMRRLHNLARMGPDILDVVTTTLLSPAAGVAQVVRKVAEKAREETGLRSVK